MKFSELRHGDLVTVTSKMMPVFDTEIVSVSDEYLYVKGLSDLAFDRVTGIAIDNTARIVPLD